MTEERSPNDGDRGQIHELLASRRRFLEAAGAAGVVAGVGGLAYGSQAETTFEFGGEVGGWQGRAPDAIAGETNPTLELVPGETYTVVWENTDGQPHNFVVETADGEHLVETEIVSEQGETQTVEFEATAEMAEYYCEVHPTSMRGEIQVGEAAEGDAEEPAEAARFVPEGPSVGVELVADGPLVNPTTFRSVPGEENTHLVIDQPGTVYVFQDGDLRDEPFLDLSDAVVILAEAEGGFDRPEGFDERGLLGLAFHPEFAENGQFYVRYSSDEPVDGEDLVGPPGREFPDEWDHVEVLSEFQVAGDDGGGAALQADRDSERVLLEIPSPQFNHNGGEVVFGPDGHLYASIGDGGDGNDTGVGHVDDWYDGNEGGNAQNVEANLLGSVLRLDVDEEGDDRPYAIPEDNPLVDTSGYDEIYAYGLRNPWRMSFDGDRLIAADVGQVLFEEVDVIENGGNYGWNVKEGFHCFDAADETTPPQDCPDSEPDEAPYDGSEFVDPVLEYPHRYQDQPVGISITGGYVYDGDAIEELGGQYVFGDWSASFVEPQGRIFAATPQEDAADVDVGGDGNATDANETQAGGNETGADGNETLTGGNETEAEGNETQTGGNETEGEGEDPSPEEEVDIPAPDEQPWQWAEVAIEGGEDGQLNRFLQGFGRDADGELYVLASRTGRLEGTGGELYRLVPPGEGEAVEAPQVDVATQAEEDEGDGDEGANETATNETATNETAGNETAGNETTGDETAGNETAGNETEGNETGE